MPTFGIIFFAIFLAEFSYSMYKKDGVYTPKQTSTNILTGLLVQLRTFLTSRFYLPFFFGIVALYVPLHLNEKITVGSFIACLFALDFMRYCYHRLEHNVDFLWMFHFVHHSDYQVNVGTTSRVSPFEVYFLYLFFIPLLFVGFSLPTLFLAYVCIVIYEIFIHEPYIKFPKVMEYVFITNGIHLVHHDSVFRNQNANFGGLFSIWDRALGTYIPPTEHSVPGIVGYHEDNFIKVQIDPIVAYFKKNFSSN